MTNNQTRTPFKHNLAIAIIWSFAGAVNTFSTISKSFNEDTSGAFLYGAIALANFSLAAFYYNMHKKEQKKALEASNPATPSV